MKVTGGRAMRTWVAVPSFLAILTVLAVSPAVHGADAGDAKVIFPPADLLTTSESITLRGMCAGAAPAATMGGKALELECDDWSLTGEIELSAGANLIRVGKVDHWVFVVKKLTTAEQVETVTLPGGAEMKRTFRAAMLHPAVEDGCDVCHEEPPGEATPEVPDGCWNCHDDPRVHGEEGFEYQHPPAEDDECSSCHDFHVGRAHHILSGPEAELCVDCHDDVRMDPDGEEWVSKHPPVAKGRCSGCHSLHGGEREHLVRKATLKLCKGCHTNVHKVHRKVPKKKKGRPAKIVLPADFPVQGNYLVCTGCHQPHGSTFPSLFPASQGELCLRCHKF